MRHKSFRTAHACQPELSQWSHIMDRITTRTTLIQTIRRTNQEWNRNVDKIIDQFPCQHTDRLKGLMAVALHDAHSQKESNVSQAAKSWATCAHRQLKSGASSAHRLAKRDEAVGFDFTTMGTGPNRSAEPCRLLAENSGGIERHLSPPRRWSHCALACRQSGIPPAAHYGAGHL